MPSGEIKINIFSENGASNDGQLIAEAKKSPEAFARLYRRHYDCVLRYCVHRLFERQAAEDITSAVFLRVVENLRKFHGDEQSFRNWLYKIATNEANNHLRKAGRRRRSLNALKNQGTNNSTQNKHTVDDNNKKNELLKQALLSLKPRYQTIITLRFFESMKTKQIAEVLGLKPATARSRLSRAVDELRKKMALAGKEI